VYLLGGAIIALGPGQLLLSVLPHPDAAGRQGLQLGVGAVMLLVGGAVWRNRHSLSDREVPKFIREPQGRSSTLLGAMIMAVELPTAFPYFAAIAAIVGSGIGVIRQLSLLLLFNLCFVLPLLCILGTLSVAPDRAQERLSRARLFLHRHWPRLLGGLMLLVGVFVVLIGATGLAGHAHGRVARFFRHVHKLLKP
jgi:cytochrome c biogenesis protein CcdA